jgi:hypothetical protein
MKGKWLLATGMPLLSDFKWQLKLELRNAKRKYFSFLALDMIPASSYHSAIF